MSSHTEIAAAIAAHKPLPPFDSALTLDTAYQTQHDVTRELCPNGRGGIKAGVTNSFAQEFLGLEHALIASLYADGQFANHCSLPFLEGRAVELEIAVMLDAAGHPTAIAPAIELVYLKFGRDEDMSAANLVACNLGADQFIVGTPQPWSSDYDDLPITLTHNGEEVVATNTAEALGGPTQASAWMWREAQARQFDCQESTLLLTGACGQVVPGQVGSYRADYGPLGSINFEIVDG